MKKTLIAVAALAATGAFAQATVYGRADVGYGSITTTTAGVDTKTSGVMSKGSVSSFIGVQGSEDLGGGLKAVYKFEGNMDPASGNYPASASKPNAGFEFDRWSYVGVQGGFGTVTAGRHYLPVFNIIAANDAFGLSTFSPVNLLKPAGTTSAPNQIVYGSPVMNGLKLDLSLENNEAGGVKTTGNNVAVSYSNGPLYAAYGAGSTQTDNGVVVNKTEGSALAASYNLNVAKITALLITQKGQGGAPDAKETNIQGTMPMGKITLKLGISQNDNGTNTGSDTMLGADYALSAKTALYAVTGSWNNFGSNKSTGTALGIKTVF